MTCPGDQQGWLEKIRVQRAKIDALPKSKAARTAEERILATMLNSATLAERAVSLGGPMKPDDDRQPPRSDAMDALRSLMLSPVIAHRERRAKR